MTGIDPQEYGQLTQQVRNLEKTVEKMATQMDELLALVNQGRGAFWLAILLGGAISSVITFLATKLGIGIIK